LPQDMQKLTTPGTKIAYIDLPAEAYACLPLIAMATVGDILNTGMSAMRDAITRLGIADLTSQQIADVVEGVERTLHFYGYELVA
jgi:hypothetical protein